MKSRGVRLVGGLQALDLGSEQACAARARVHVEPGHRAVDVEGQVVGGPQGRERDDAASVAHAHVGDVDVLAQEAVRPHPREAAGGIDLDGVVEARDPEDLVRGALAVVLDLEVGLEVVAPEQEHAWVDPVRRERLAVPRGREVRAVRREGVAQQELRGHGVPLVGPPLRVGAEDAVVAGAFVLAAGVEEAHERAAEVATHAARSPPPTRSPGARDEGYVYSQGVAGAKEELAITAVGVMRESGVPIELDGKTCFNEPVERGIIGPVTDSSIDELMSARTVVVGGAARPGPAATTVLLLETPAAALPLERRIAAHATLIRRLSTYLITAPDGF
jgi:hypothetical protein